MRVFQEQFWNNFRHNFGDNYGDNFSDNFIDNFEPIWGDNSMTYSGTILGQLQG